MIECYPEGGQVRIGYNGPGTCNTCSTIRIPMVDTGRRKSAAQQHNDRQSHSGTIVRPAEIYI
ncbi:unnamed protein product [Nesidiocoris tenuis]|uniref:Uncharacterized protein n=1 Tax=Nesidiocoris tenuis TaxID=355587 RepID=A0A6H5H910_9HEMI|nr:unnamed protein product [Nesidiocoris tenuis]CAB0012078.1 unnamed protein product [Nesidiocoris tenuis]